MIVSEVLDAIDNINSITIESEISMCESLLSSYDKMLLIEEHYEGNDINDFKIFQEGLVDDIKNDVKKQNEGKSTLNKILLTIPRIIIALFKSIGNKIKGIFDKSKKLDTELKKAPKESKSLLAKLFPKKSKGKVDVKQAVKSSIIAGAAVGGAIGIGRGVKSILDTNKKFAKYLIEDIKIDEKDKNELYKHTLELVNHISDIYNKLPKEKRQDLSAVRNELENDDKCKNLCSPLKQYRNVIYNSKNFKDIKLRILNNKQYTMIEYLTLITLIYHLGVIKKDKDGNVIPESGVNLTVEELQNIINDIDPDNIIEIDPDINKSDDDDSSINDEMINKLAINVKGKLSILDEYMEKKTNGIADLHIMYDEDSNAFEYYYLTKVFGDTSPLYYTINNMMKCIYNIDLGLKVHIASEEDDEKYDNIKIPFTADNFFSENKAGSLQKLVDNLKKFIQSKDYKNATEKINNYNEKEISDTIQKLYNKEYETEMIDKRKAYITTEFNHLKGYVTKFNMFVDSIDKILSGLLKVDNLYLGYSNKDLKPTEIKDTIPELDFKTQSLAIGNDPRSLYRANLPNL